MTPVRLFVSYPRSQKQAVEAACAALGDCGVQVWLDAQDIDPFDDFSERIRQGLALSQAVLLWWSAGYAESDFCMQEFRLAWQWARQHGQAFGQRLLVVNPEPNAQHIDAGDLAPQQFLSAPPTGAEPAWAAALRDRLAQLADAGPLAPADYSVPPPQAWHGRPLPSRRAHVGRGGALMRLHSALFPVRLDANPGPLLAQLHGMAGIGKSALAAHYAETFGAAFPGGIWWFDLSAWAEVARPDDDVDVASAAWLSALESALAATEPDLLAALSRDAQHQALPPATVRERLARQLGAAGGPCLWVLDNFPPGLRQDRREAIAAWLRAPVANGRTLLTCRDAEPLAEAVDLPLTTLPVPQARTLLARCLAPGQRQQDLDCIAALVDEIGGHPLALLLVGERAARASQGLAPVLNAVRRHGALAELEQIQRRLEPRLGKIARSVLAAFTTSLAPLNPSAQRLLALTSLCAPGRRIPTPLLRRAFALTSNGARDAMGDGDAAACFDDALDTLWRGCLLESDGRDLRHATVHAMVAAVARQALQRPPGADQQGVAQALVERLLPLDSDAGAFVALRDDVAHVQALLAPRDASQSTAPSGRTGVLLGLGLARQQISDDHPVQALVAARQAVALAEGSLVGEDRDRLRALTTLSAALAQSGDLAAARALQETLLPVVQRVFGPVDDDALAVGFLLGASLREQRHLSQAEQLQRSLLTRLSDLPERRYRSSVAALSELAVTLHLQGHLAEALALQLQALELVRCHLPAQHPDTLIARHNVAALRAALGQADAAQRELAQVLSLAEQHLGVGHPYTRQMRSSLADSLARRQDFAPALAQYHQAWVGAREALGEGDPETLVWLARLCGAIGATGDRTAAQALEAHLVAQASVALATGHPDVLVAIESLAGGLKDQGQPFGHLAPLLAQVLQTRRRDLGEGHLQTLRAYSNLALAQSELGDTAQSVALRRGALQAAQSLPGDAGVRDAETFSAWVELIAALQADGQAAAAQALEPEAKAILHRLHRSPTRH